MLWCCWTGSRGRRLEQWALPSSRRPILIPLHSLHEINERKWRKRGWTDANKQINSADLRGVCQAKQYTLQLPIRPAAIRDQQTRTNSICTISIEPGIIMRPAVLSRCQAVSLLFHWACRADCSIQRSTPSTIVSLSALNILVVIVLLPSPSPATAARPLQ